ncbi:MAG: hypothetical protein C0602_04245 [Denitrovibrio sp.]|nr:MAG: hypothetical protein C0602_04245 [Denitrovibrio sp.]
MKQLININLAKITTVTWFRKLLILTTILTVLSGGDSFAQERYKYKVIVARPGKNVTTQLRVYAENQEEARENVALNGWQILSIEEIMDTTPGDTLTRGAESGTTFNINITKVGKGEVVPTGDVSVADGDSLQIDFSPGPCEKLDKLLYNGAELQITGPKHTLDNITKDGYVVAVFNENGSQCAENGIFSENLKEVGAIYFALGKFRKDLTEAEANVINSVKDQHNYVIIGHTDDVRVIPNEKFSDNFQLSVKRAEFVLKQLADSGFNTEAIKIVGLGPAFPAAPNMKEGQPLNRRAVLYERTN